MVVKGFVLKVQTALDSKPAAMFIQMASAYKASIWIEKGERKANAKSLLGVLSLGIGSDTKINIIAEGEDEDRAVAELGEYITNLNPVGKA